MKKLLCVFMCLWCVNLQASVRVGLVSYVENTNRLAYGKIRENLKNFQGTLTSYQGHIGEIIILLDRANVLLDTLEKLGGQNEMVRLGATYSLIERYEDELKEILQKMEEFQKNNETNVIEINDPQIATTSQFYSSSPIDRKRYFDDSEAETIPVITAMHSGSVAHHDNHNKELEAE